MKRHFKRGVSLLFALLISISLCGCRESDDFIKPTKEFFVNDFAEVITAQDKQAIYSQGADRRICFGSWSRVGRR